MSANAGTKFNTTVTWRSPQEGEAWVAAQMAQWTRPVVLLLEGPMGAGKTQITKWIVQTLSHGSPQVPVQSPTFGIHHRYATPKGAIDHVDLYRLDSDADLESTGFWDLFKESDFVIVEWADRLPPSVWPADWQKVRLKISVVSATERSVKYESF